jgi:Cu-Zn family superoxide dismutase
VRYVAGAFIVIAAAFVISGVAAAFMLTVQVARAQSGAELRNASGASVGRATLAQTPNGVLVSVDLTKVPAGRHAFRIHETGRCEPPFESAGGHIRPNDRRHGFLHAAGPHAGDLPNVEVPPSGALSFEVLARDVSLENGSGGLHDADGSALVLHGGLGDDRTDPASGAGGRIACGVVTR